MGREVVVLRQKKGCNNSALKPPPPAPRRPQPFPWTKEAQKTGLAGNRTLDHSHAASLKEELMLREYYTTKPQAPLNWC
jgi:hypothetical protein